MMSVPKMVALDSSHWAKWIHDAFSLDLAVRREARRFADDLLRFGYTLLFSWHHLQELMAIDDAGLVADRLLFVQQIQFLSWIGSVGGDDGLGGITDVMAAEALAAFREGGDALAVRRAARPLLLRSGSGRDIVPEHPLFLALMMEWAQRSADRARTITAISPVQFIEPKRTVGELMTGQIRSPDDVKRVLAAQQQALARETAARGDRRIANPHERAGAFMQEVADFGRNLPGTARELVLRGLAAQGIDADEVHSNTTMAEVDRLALFRGQLRVVAPKTGIPFEILKRRIRADQMPHRVIGNTLKANAQVRKERKGSDLNDGYLATLAAYADVLYVDKRTAENFRRATGKEPKLATLIGRIEKAPSWRAILCALGS